MTDTDAYDRGARDVLELVRQVADIAPAALVLGAGTPLTLKRLAQALGAVDPQTLHVLRPFDRREAVSLRTAAQLAGRSENCVRDWAARYGIGRRVVSSMMISRPALLMLLDGDALALGRYLSGDRTAAHVRAYFDRSAAAA